jgi:hypothetical protein
VACGLPYPGSLDIRPESRCEYTGWIAFLPGRPNDARRRSHRYEGLAPSHKGKITQIHEVQFYSDEDGFLDTFSDFIALRLKAGNAGIVIATELNRLRLFSKLQTGGVDVISAIERWSLIAI